MKLNTIDKVKLINLKAINHSDANLNIFENVNNFFKIKRIFTIEINKFNKNNRGMHAHKRDQQIVTCPYGEIEFIVKDGLKKKKFIIKDRKKAIFVPKHIWTETNYKKKNTIVTCYCSHNYNELSYIRDYKEYLKFRKL